MKKIIGKLYAGGTRGARVLNLMLSTVWVVSTFLYLIHFNVVLPYGIIHEVPTIAGLAIFTVILTVGSFISVKYAMRYKTISLHTGALLQALISMGYANSYPLLEVATATTFMIALWLIGAAYFVMDEDLTKESKRDSTVISSPDR